MAGLKKTKAMGDEAAKKGPNPGERLKDALVPSVNPVRFFTGDFTKPKGPTVGQKGPHKILMIPGSAHGMDAD